MQRALISFIVFVCVILIFDMMWNDSMLTLELYRGLRTAARHFDNAASNLVAFLNRR
jgi:hypothetical protein